MTHARLLFPHPVLRDGGIDYIDGYNFVAELLVHRKYPKIQLSVKHLLVSDFLTRLIQNGHAKYFATLKCAKTGQRLAYKTDHQSYTWNLDENNFRGRLLFSSYVVAENNIDPFESEEHDLEIRGMVNDVPVGSILAIGNQIEILLDKIEGNVGAVIQLIHNDSVEDGMYDIVLNDDLIKIVMSRTTLAYTKRLRAKFPHILLPILYVPAIECAIRNLTNYRDNMWAEAIMDALRKHNYTVENMDDEENLNHIVQKLMNNPYKHTFALIEDGDFDD